MFNTTLSEQINEIDLSQTLSMTEMEVLDNELFTKTERRRKLLPVWIKVFLWIFMLFGVIAPVGLVLGVFGVEYNLSLYGLETNTPLSPIGLVIISFFALKGIVSVGLWTEKDWAINIAIIDAIIGIATCIIVMLVLPIVSKSSGFHFTFKLELLVLIPYLIKMKNIRGEWESRNYLSTIE